MSTKPTTYEVMATTISHELKDNEKWFLGLATGEQTILMLSRVPIAGMALAQLTHAPNSVPLVFGWILNPVASEIPTGCESTIGTELYDWSCECQDTNGTRAYFASRGEVDVGFGSVAQIDKYGNCNSTAIGDYYKPSVRLIGPINLTGHLALFGREIIVFDHQKRNFVDKVDYVTGVGFIDGPGAREKLDMVGGGPCMILTDKAVFDFHPETKLARLKSVHPGVSLDWVIENTGFTHDYVPKEVPETPLPTDEELRLIREVVSPGGVLLPL